MMLQMRGSSALLSRVETRSLLAPPSSPSLSPPLSLLPSNVVQLILMTILPPPPLQNEGDVCGSPLQTQGRSLPLVPWCPGISPNLLLSSLLLLPRPYHPSPHTLPPSSPLLLGQHWLTRCLPQLSLPPPLHPHHTRRLSQPTIPHLPPHLHPHHVQHLSQQSQRACSPPPHPLLHSHHVPSHHLLPPHLPPPSLSTPHHAQQS